MSQQDNHGVLLLHDLIRKVSLSSFQELSGIEAATIAEYSFPDRLVFGYKAALVLIHSDWFDCLFKVHFSISSAKVIYTAASGIDVGESDGDQAVDFLKEYTNMFGGHFIGELANNQVRAELSIPALTDGFDEALRIETGYGDQKSDIWQIGFSHQAIVLTAENYIKNHDLFQNIKNDLTLSPKQSFTVLNKKPRG